MVGWFGIAVTSFVGGKKLIYAELVLGWVTVFGWVYHLGM